jgi:hypothetical protein
MREGPDEDHSGSHTGKKTDGEYRGNSVSPFMENSGLKSWQSPPVNKLFRLMFRDWRRSARKPLKLYGMID